jgi:RHS repeat-associated protein
MLSNDFSKMQRGTNEINMRSRNINNNNNPPSVEQRAETARAQGASSSSSSLLPSISLPKGGGAIRGIGEKFTANPVTGTASLTVPIYTSPGRSGFGPQLSLSYDSGSGNGPYGFGWSLSLPSITRKSDKGLPKYQDAEESDVFILSGTEDLVPVFKKDNKGQWELDENGNYIIDEDPDRDGYIVRRYRPRIEGLFARIERWIHKSDGDTHWRSISKDNILTVYGRDERSRISDPADKNRIFSWLICESYDDKGNAIVYEYTDENDNGIDLSQANERNRSRAANRYIKRIWYGNRRPLLLDINKPSFRKSHLERTDFSSAGWMFEVVFDYGGEDHYIVMPLDSSLSEAEQHRYVLASANASLENSPNNAAWLSRPDPFSNYRAGFEVRTYRRCQRVLMFHRFPELGSEPYLVRSTEFDYSDFDYSQVGEEHRLEAKAELEYKGSTRFASFIQSITQSGHVLDDTKPVRVTNGIKYLSYLKKSLPPLEFEYSPATIHEDVKEVDPLSLENLPSGLDGTLYQVVDLDGEGLSGILTEQGGAWFYKRNISSLHSIGDEGKAVSTVAQFAPIERLKDVPSPGNLGTSGQQLMDLSSDGQLDLVQFNGPLAGFFERTTDEKWNTFNPFTSLPNIRWDDPTLKFIDLTGDGHADVMITEDHAFVWYPSLGERGFAEDAIKVRQSFDEEKGPRLVFADGIQSIYLTDMSGDGLTDLVRVRNGEVCYWPNLGYGRFGAKVTMDNSPWFDTSDQFNQRRIRLADIDGSGVTDIVYFSGRNGVQIYFNQSGNRWSDAYTISNFPHIDNLASIQLADLLGNGTACMIWSSSLPRDSSRQIRYIDLMYGNKPHLMVSSKNNLGAETRVHYASSSKFYIADKIAGKPWITKLPFPVHVVERIETYDRISLNLFVTRYAYHHGHFDGTEREFRGFGMVEQWDTEEMDEVFGSDTTTRTSHDTNWDAASFVPPVVTRTWFHTGTYFEDNNTSRRISKQFEEEYYHEGDPSLREGELSQDQIESMLLPDTILPAPDDGNLNAEETREACRALKGSILRQETYALDRRPDGILTGESDRPYTISERNYTIKRLQPRGSKNKHAVFFVHPRETIDFQYERKLYDIVIAGGQTKRRPDPRVMHNVILKVDDYGNILTSVAIGYGRRLHAGPGLSSSEIDIQKKTLITYTENRYTRPYPDADTDVLPRYDNAYRTPVPAETRTFEVINFEPPPRLQDPLKAKEITNLFLFDKLEELLVNTSDLSQGNWDIPYHDVTNTQARDDHAYRRLIEHVRVVYRSNQLDRLLPLGNIDSLALPGETYKMAFTSGLLAAVYQRESTGGQPPENLTPIPSIILGSKNSDGGGYVDLDGNGNWWIPSGRVFYWPEYMDNSLGELEFAIRHFFLPHRFCDPFDKNTIVAYDSSETEYKRNHNLLLTEKRDPLGNKVVAKNNYRTLQPEYITDPNMAINEVLFDALGLVTATAVHKGQVGDSLVNVQADLTQKQLNDFIVNPKDQAMTRLGPATTYTIYDINRYYYLKSNPDKPPYAVTIMRETHSSDPITSSHATGMQKVQISFSYSDGFGREIQKKIQAEAGLLNGVKTDPRWVASGWTIFNNKGKAVRKYEPFFDHVHEFSFGKEVGVSSILFYDPIGRLVTTLYANNTYQKTIFDPWYQTTYDSNDTVTLDPSTDGDIRGYVSRYMASQPDGGSWKSWYDQRIGGSFGPVEQKTAQKTEAHANTRSTTYFDTLGRTFLTVANNGTDANGNDVIYKTQILLDIEGNQRQFVDAKDRIVMRYDYDMLGNRIRQASMEAGARWILNNVNGKPMRVWDSRGFSRRMTYDALQRPVELFVRHIAIDEEPVVIKTIYGETKPNPEATNHRLKIWELRDQAGVLINESYDFKGNLLLSTRRFLSDYRAQFVDWAQNPSPQLETEIFTSRTSYDALNRTIQIVAPKSSRAGTKINVIQPVYNEANLLDQIYAWLQQVAEPSNLLDPRTATHQIVKNIDYNAKGQREHIEYVMEDGNSVWTINEYDEKTFRLVHMETRRKRSGHSEEELLQDLHYTYDPVGNIMHIHDGAQQELFVKGRSVEPSTDYKYDAVYRLTEAIGREHLGRSNGSANATEPTSHTDNPRVGLNLNDPNLLATYHEKYLYDSVGNIEKIEHEGSDPSDPGWTRIYSYDEDSLIEADKKNNRLSSTMVRGTTYSYKHDAHGNETRMPHLAHHDPNEYENMHWDSKDQLQKVDLDGGGIAYYIYDASGRRVRKIHEHNGALMEERIYLGNFEVYRKRTGMRLSLVLERETLHVVDDNRPIALIEMRTIGNDDSPEQLVRYQFNNHLGSALLELDNYASIMSYEEYYPYGSTSFQAGRTIAEVRLKRYRYIAKERDEETGFYYNGMRYYASWLGRWVSADPGGNIDGLNLYCYVRGNPLSRVDDDGMQSSSSDDRLHQVSGAAAAGSAVVRANNPPHKTTGSPPRPSPMTYQQARAEANRGAKAFKQQTGASGRIVQGGHSITARHAPESGVTAAEMNDPKTMLQVHSRRDPNLHGTLTDDKGSVRRTLHNTHEYMNDSAAAQSRAGTGGKLTAPGHIEAGNQVVWQSENVPLDQRNVDYIRSSGRARNPGPLVSPETGQVLEGPLPAPPPAPTKQSSPPPQLTPPRELTVLPPGRGMRFLSSAMQFATSAAKYAGYVSTGLGAYNEAVKTAELERRNNRGMLNEGTMFLSTLVAGVYAGIIDDALAAATIHIGSAPVIQSWEQHGSGPAQHLAGEAIRGILQWGAEHGL